jgi:hypothetical protein
MITNSPSGSSDHGFSLLAAINFIEPGFANTSGFDK